MKKFLCGIISVGLLAAVLSGCGSKEFNAAGGINPVTREPGSGTRGAFTELFGLVEKQADGSSKDLITNNASVESSTNTILVTVSNDLYAIGYVSMGSLNDSVKAVQINGVDPTVANVKNDTYPVKRPFNIATKGDPTGVVKDFIDFILSKDGQDIANQSYIAIDESAAAYAGDKPGGSIVVGGSSSVSPLMEKLIEGYKAVNPNANVQLQVTDSTTGMTKAIDGTYDIGMASRDLSDNEKATLQSINIALDGIAVIVNPQNTVTNLTKDDVKNIFLGQTTVWSDVIQ